MLLIVGLGNPGREYESHRHNVGFMVADWLVGERGEGPFRAKFSGQLARLRPKAGAEGPVVLKPQTFMNCSGDSVQPAAAFFKCDIGELIVVHDELDLPFGEVRLKKGGGHAGHNGLRSIMARFGNDGEFCRVRFGIGRPPTSFRGDVADFVLSPFSGEERAELPRLLKLAGESVLDIATRGFTAAANTRNTRPKPKKPRPEPAPEGAPTGSGDALAGPTGRAGAPQD